MRHTFQQWMHNWIYVRCKYDGTQYNMVCSIEADSMKCVHWRAYVNAYKFHLILSIRFSFGSNEQFTENLADIFKWTRLHTARHGTNIPCTVYLCVHCIWCCASHTWKMFDSDFRVTLSVGQKPNRTFFPFEFRSMLVECLFLFVLVNEKRIKFEIAFGFVRLCLVLKTIVLVVFRIAFCIM